VVITLTMGHFEEFAGYAKIYSIWWFLFSVWEARKILISLDERHKEIEELIDGVVNLLRLLSVSALRKIYAVLWLLLNTFDVLGIVLLVEFVGKIDWWVKLLVIVTVLTIINSIPLLIDNLRSMDDMEQFRTSLMKYLEPWSLRIANAGMLFRLFAAITLVVVVNI